MICLNVEEDVFIAVDLRDILSNFVKQKKKILIDPRKEIYTKSLKMMISPSPYSLVDEIFLLKTSSAEVFDWKGFLSISGSTWNVTDRATWETLKEQKVKFVARKSNRKLYSY